MMKKVDVVLEIGKQEELKKICDEYGIRDIIFSEVKIYNSNIVRVKKYRGAEYEVSLILKLKAEFIIEEKIEKEFITRIQNEIINLEDGDSLVVSLVDYMNKIE